MNISESLKSKAGPLPVWAWGLIIGVIIVAGMYWRSSRSAIVSASSDEGALVAYPDLDGSSGGASGVPSVVDASGNSGSSTPQFSSNLAWMTYVIAALVKEGNSPLTVQSALQKYLSGKALNSAEQALVNQALSRFGLPPNGTDGPVDVGMDIPIVTPTPMPVVKDNTQTFVYVDKNPAVQGSGILANTAIYEANKNNPVWNNIATTANQQYAADQEWLARTDVSQADKDALRNSARYKALLQTVGK